jgi:gliding motility-associated-like protein
VDANGCPLIDSTEVYEAEHFGVDILVVSDFNGAVISCADYSDGAIVVDTANLGGTWPYTYMWNTGATSFDLVDVPAGNYQVVVVDKHSCVDSAEISIDDPLPIDLTIYPDDPLCYGDSTGEINLEITGGTVFSIDDYIVQLNGSITEPFTSNLPEGVYQLRVEDLNDCFTEDETELINPPLLVLSFETENAFCQDKPDGEMSLYIDGGIPGYWITWSGGLPDNEDHFYERRSGEYVATVTDANQCLVSDTVVVGYTFESCLVIPNAFSPNGDGFNDTWVIEGLELYPNAEMRIFDRWGTRIYYSPNAVDDPWDGTFDGRTLPIDSYHYVIDLNNDEPGVTGNVTIVR